MSSAVPSCETIQVVLFRGDRSGAFGARIKRELDEQKNGLGPGPAALDCLLLTGHTGVSTDGGTTTYGFKPDASGIPLWELMERLKSGDSFPGTGSSSSRSKCSCPVRVSKISEADLTANGKPASILWLSQRGGRL